MNIITENNIIIEDNNSVEYNYKHTVLRFNGSGTSIIINTSVRSNLFMGDTKFHSGNNMLIDHTNNLLLAVQYKNNEMPSSKFFKSSFDVIRIYDYFITNPFYKSLFSSFKSYILKPAVQKGILFEVVKTQPEMFTNITDVLNIPNFQTIEDYKAFSNNTLNLIRTT